MGPSPVPSVAPGRRAPAHAPGDPRAWRPPHGPRRRRRRGSPDC
jgi:hypothetical protein